MCKFKLPESSNPKSCQIAGYFEQIRLSRPDSNPILDRDSLPFDGEGYCIFHSHDIDFKVKNKLQQWTDILIRDRSYGETLDLTGVVLIGTPLKLANGGTETALRFSKWKVNQNTKIILDHAEINDKIGFEECRLDKLQISFNKTTINGEMLFSNTRIEQISFNDARLNGGLVMNKCEIAAYAEFAGMKIKNVFQLTNVDFKTHAYFNNSNFDCESVYLDHVNFNGKADFSMSTFHCDVNMEECVFGDRLVFTDAAFYGPVALSCNQYQENVLFNSNEHNNKMFHDTVEFLFIDKESEVRQQIIFDRVNYYMISGSVRQELAQLARLNKVAIGAGCIKYRVQSPQVTIKTNDINKNIAKELANSFTNYFTSSTGKNLGVEFIDHSIHSITIFYFSDEDISQEEFMTRLKDAERGYWNLGPPAKTDSSSEETKNKIDTYVSQVAVLTKIHLLRQLGLYKDEDTKTIVRAVNFDPTLDKSNEINLNINIMNIKKVVAHPNSHVVIAEKIKHLEIKPEFQHVDKKGFEQIRDLLTKLNEEEIQGLREELSTISTEIQEPGTLDRVKMKLTQLALRHSTPMAEGIASSVIYDVLKAVLLG